MTERCSVRDYLAGPETLRRRELEWGVVREPPAPFYAHQARVTRLTVLLDEHVRARALGRVVVSPIDVVLDANRALIVQPDVVFVAASRVAMIHNQIWGAPDLVVEVLSPWTARRDRTKKLDWYQHYGVRECWLVAPRPWRIEVHAFQPARRTRIFRTGRLRSAVLPDLNIRVADVFRD